MKKEGLKDWIIHYIKSRNLIENNILEIKEDLDGYDLIIKRKDKDQHILILPLLEDMAALEKKCNNKNLLVVIANTRKNLSFLLKNWLRLVTYKRLCFYFVNPKSLTEKRWIIYPHTHNAVIEKSAFKKGLEALFATVEEAV